jgi:FkbM family methyltransferase
LSSNIVLGAFAWVAKMLPMSLKMSIYRTGLFSHLLRSGINLLVSDGKSTVKVVSGELAGTKLSLYLKSEKDYWLGTYETELQSVIIDRVSPGMVIYDLGANIGYLSLLFSKLVSETGRVFAFEALPENIARIKENLSLNLKTSNIDIVHRAVIDKNIKIDFLVGPSGGTGKVLGSAGRQNINYQKKISIEGTSIDNFVFKEKKPVPDLIKIDIEGGEILALSGMERVLNHIKPIILLEIHGPEAASDCWKILQDAGYEICLIKRGCHRVLSPGELAWKSYVIAQKTN